MPVVKKPKKGKKVRRPKGNRVATAPTRDVIINISTAKPRASKTLKPAMTKRSEDLSGRIKDFEIFNALNKNPKLKEKFEFFSESKRREFAEYIIDAKRISTKESRLEKIIPMILKGEGLNDKYRNC